MRLPWVPQKNPEDSDILDLNTQRQWNREGGGWGISPERNFAKERNRNTNRKRAEREDWGCFPTYTLFWTGKMFLFTGKKLQLQAEGRLCILWESISRLSELYLHDIVQQSWLISTPPAAKSPIQTPESVDCRNLHIWWSAKISRGTMTLSVLCRWHHWVSCILQVFFLFFLLQLFISPTDRKKQCVQP